MKSYLTPLILLAIVVTLFLFGRIADLPLFYENVIILIVLFIVIFSTLVSLPFLLKAKRIGLIYLAPLAFFAAILILHNFEKKKASKYIISKMQEVGSDRRDPPNNATLFKGQDDQ